MASLALALNAQEADSRWRLSGFGTLGLALNSTESVLKKPLRGSNDIGA